MAITKNKIELLDKTISLESAIDEYFNEGYDDYYDYYDYCYYGCSCPACLGLPDDDYKYKKEESCDLIYKFKRGRIISFGNKPIIGRMIDMKTVYSKNIMRQKNIDIVLGLSKEFQKITIGDLYEERGNIQRKLDS